jgi:hypothetical protein
MFLEQRPWGRVVDKISFREIPGHFREISFRKAEVSWLLPVAEFRNHPTVGVLLIDSVLLKFDLCSLFHTLLHFLWRNFEV